jgi:uncharacterized membrane protein (UPF0127 family)
MKVLDKETGQVLLKRVLPAYSFWRRLKGLMFKKSLPPESGVHIKPCQSIHTFFMKMSIDVIYVDKEMTIVGMEHSLPPSQFGKHFKNAHAVIEMGAGSISESNFYVGQALKLKNEKGEI